MYVYTALYARVLKEKLSRLVGDIALVTGYIRIITAKLYAFARLCHRYDVEDAYALENALYIVVAVTPSAQYVKGQVDLSRRFNFYTFHIFTPCVRL